MTRSAHQAGLPKLWDDLSLRTYLSEVSRRHGVVDALALPNMRDLPPIRIERLYVHPRLSTSAVSPATAPETWPGGESLFAALQSAPCLVLLGDPGSGKTTLTNWLAWRLASGLVTTLPSALDERVPIPCVLREMPAAAFASDVKVADLAELVAERLLGEQTDAPTRASLRARVDAKQYVLILDGIDEIKVAHRKVVAAWIRQASHDGACVVATARIVGYEDYPVDRPYVPPPAMDREPALPGEPLRHMRAPSCADEDAERQAQRWAQIRFLMPFNQKRIGFFVENWYLQRSGSELEAGEKAQDFLYALNKSEFMQELARTPNLLSLMAIVYRERAYLPDGKALLYKEIANAYINTIDRQRKIDDNALAPYTWEVRESWLAFVGFQMQLEREDAEDEQSDSGLLVSEGKVLDWLAQAMAASNVIDAQDRARDFLGWVARRSGLLLPRGEGRYAFVHLSFQEYFCARYLAGRIMSPAFIKNKQSDDAPVTREKLFEWSDTTLWRESLVYLLELISGERDVDWVEDLLEILFDSPTSTRDFSEHRAHLFARILTDRHIHVTPRLRSALAKRCVSAAVTEWQYTAVIGDHSVLTALVRTNYAAIVVSPETPLDERFKDLPTVTPDKLQYLSDDENLYILIARGRAVEDVSQVVRFRNLQLLDLGQLQTPDIAAIAHLKSLQYLNLSDTQVDNIEALAGLHCLRELDLGATKVKDISPLSNAANLEVLELAKTPVQDISVLASLRKIRILSLSDSSVTDISALKNMSKLHFLHLDRTAIADITALRNSTKLWYLSLGDTLVTDLAPLKELSSLRILNIVRTPVQDVSILAHLKYLKIRR